jgi:hypothetical protein
MLFKPYLIEPILDGRKTETRRLWKRCLVKANKLYDARTDFHNKSIFATIKITYVRKEKLGSINDDGIRREGCTSIEEFRKIWIDIYGRWDPDTEVFVIGFRVI